MKSVLHTLLLGFALVLILNGCAKQPETIVIDENPESPTATSEPEDSTDVAPTSADFKQLIIGEIHPVTTLDPLFADNNSMRHILQIFHEGLVRFDQNGEVVPGLARSWSVSNDSLIYTFTLRSEVYYHDHPVFSNGLGRRVVAPDVKFAFERMAKNTVPGDAAKLFMDIEGFEPYFNEQHKVLNPAYRELSGVSGINTPNNTTVRFQLVEKDQSFLQKLASPYAVIYPREAIAASPRDFAAVGAGPFRHSNSRGDSLYIFSKFNSYWQASNSLPVLDRVDVRVNSNEGQLLKLLAGNEIHLIPELGPAIMETVLSGDGNLLPAYRRNFALHTAGGRTTYTIDYNPGSATSRQTVHALFAKLDTEQLVRGIPPGMLSLATHVNADPEADTPTSEILSTYTEDPFQRWFLQRISNQWESKQLQLLQIRTPTRHTALHNGAFVPFYEADAPQTGPNTLIHYSVGQAALSIRSIENLLFNRYPWWIDLRNADLPGIDQL